MHKVIPGRDECEKAMISWGSKAGEDILKWGNKAHARKDRRDTLAECL
jgi:hypothetical protein